MRHVWECVKAPYLASWCRGELRTGQSPHLGVVTMPGVFVCTTCSHAFRGNYPPPEDWIVLGIVPDCATETIRGVHQS